MEKEICRYHNDLNMVKLPYFTETQLNLFFNLIHKMRHKKQGEIVKFDTQEISKMIAKRNATNEQILEITRQLFGRIFQANFKKILIDNGKITEEYVHLFKTMKIIHLNDNKKIYGIELETNEHFEYLLGELLENYNEFELVEFVAIRGVYTKLIYTHLKQFRTTGKWLVKWEEFKDKLDIPPLLKPTDIDKIIKSAIKELSAERTLFDQKRIPFKNLKYQKLTKSGEPNRKKLTPYFIEFSFTPQATTKILKDKLQGIRWVWDDKIYQVANVKKENSKVVVNCFRLNRETLQVECSDRNFNFQTYEHAETTIKANKYNSVGQI